MAKHTKETLQFNSFSGYYASIPAGFGGFDWSDVDYMNATFWKVEHPDWCNTGFQNVLRGAGEAFTWNNNGYVSYGVFENTTETFSLKSMVAASGWETAQPFEVKSYTYTTGEGFVYKAGITVYLDQTSKTLKFSKLGKPGDFNNVSLIEVISGYGKFGNTCSYGPYGYTTGNQMAFDNLKVVWNGTIPKANGRVLLPGPVRFGVSHGGHIATPHLVSGAHHDANPMIHASSGSPPGSHSELQPGSLVHSHAGDLAAQIQPAAVEHFGP
jgi:hypothetical protein